MTHLWLKFFKKSLLTHSWNKNVKKIVCISIKNDVFSTKSRFSFAGKIRISTICSGKFQFLPNIFTLWRKSSFTLKLTLNKFSVIGVKFRVDREVKNLNFIRYKLYPFSTHSPEIYPRFKFWHWMIFLGVGLGRFIKIIERKRSQYLLLNEL